MSELERLATIVVDAARPTEARNQALGELRRHGVRFAEHAWRIAVREPLRARLVELGLLGAGADLDDFDDPQPLLDVDLAALTTWAIRNLKLRFVRDPADVASCATRTFRDALARVTGTPVVTEPIGSARSPYAIAVRIAGVEARLARDVAQETFDLLAAWAAKADPSRIATRLDRRGTWLPTAAQLAAARKHRLVVPPEPRPLAGPSVYDVVPAARVASFAAFEPVFDAYDEPIDATPDDDRRRLVEVACGLDPRLAAVRFEGLTATIAVAGVECAIRLPRTGRRDDRAFERGILRALTAVVEPRLGMRFALVHGGNAVLATDDELAQLRADDLLDG